MLVTVDAPMSPRWILPMLANNCAWTEQQGRGIDAITCRHHWLIAWHWGEMAAEREAMFGSISYTSAALIIHEDCRNM